MRLRLVDLTPRLHIPVVICRRIPWQSNTFNIALKLVLVASLLFVFFDIADAGRSHHQSIRGYIEA